MDRMTMLLQTDDLVLQAYIKGFPFPLDLPPALRQLCAQRMLNVIALFDLETPERVVEAVKRSLRQSVQGANLSARSQANILALFRAISDAPDDATDFADFTLDWLQSKARAW